MGTIFKYSPFCIYRNDIFKCNIKEYWRDLYTKTEIEANVGTPEMLVLPADMLDFYTKTEIDSVPAVTPEYSDTDKTTVILLDSNGNRTDEIRQFSAAATNPLSAVRSFLQGQTSNKYDVVIGKDFMTGYTGGASGVIQNSGFVNCASMVNLEIYCTSTGQGTTYVNSLGGYFCQNCTSLKRVVFPSSLRNIGTACFYNCPLLEGTIKFPGSVETIGGISFFECSSVQKIEIPATYNDEKIIYIGSHSAAHIGCNGTKPCNHF